MHFPIETEEVNKTMAKQKKEPEGPKPPAPWMSTFSDLMNLLLCFFVLLFSMSTVEEEKFEEVAASFQSAFSILPKGAAAIGDGLLISNGVSQLNELSEYFSTMGAQNNGEQMEKLETYKEQLEQIEMIQSEQMAQEIQEQLDNLLDKEVTAGIDVDFTAQYVVLQMNGALLFDSGSAQVMKQAEVYLDKIGEILQEYEDHLIEIIGHTDNVPISSSSKYNSNMELSFFRANSVTEYLRNKKGLSPENVQPSGRGEYAPIATNDTAEGRAQNRRVEVRIYREASS